jgi:hypothetical protein
MDREERLHGAEAMFEEVVADPASTGKEIQAVLTLARRWQMEMIERLTCDRIARELEITSWQQRLG